MNDCPTLYIVSPCFNEQEVLPETNRQLTAMLKQMIANGAISASSRITYVSDVQPTTPGLLSAALLT